jgi:hypothetical protein
MADTDVLISPRQPARSTLSPRTPRFKIDDSQEEPLLRTSDLDATSASAHQQLSDDEDDRSKEKLRKSTYLQLTVEQVKRNPALLAVLVIGLLLLVTVASSYNPTSMIKNPSTSSLHQGQMPEITFPSPENTIDYSNYTTFPLNPLQYAAECWKLHQGLVRHMGYWTVPGKGFMDVPHRFFPTTCNSTITYQFDQYSGLFAQLALLAQVAALAREVRSDLTNCRFNFPTTSSAGEDTTR